ncbi:F23F12.8 [Symbiodinium sp. CCMP2456]|nr:F23F12.8 [Symbiodinium sp. CCMP2456]
MGYLRSINPTKHPLFWPRLRLKLFRIRIMMRMVYQRSQLQFQNTLDSAAFRDRTLQIRPWSCLRRFRRFRRFRRLQRTANQRCLWGSLWQRLR